MNLIRAFLIIVSATLALQVLAEPPTPALKAGKFVYQIPKGYLPQRFSQSMVDELQKQAASQKYPFYIVLMDHVADDQEASRIGNRFLDDWSRSGHFNAQRASLFLVTFEGDRKYRLFPAPEWRSKLGLEKNESGDALVQFTEKFVRSAKRGNPAAGISDLMQSYNSYIFDHTDPVQIAELRKAEEALAERQRLEQEQMNRALALRESLGSLNTNIAKMRGLLSQREYLPKDVTSYQRDLERAISVLDRKDTEEMNRESLILGQSSNQLEAYVNARITEAQRAKNQKALIVIVVLGAFGGLVLLVSRRRVTYKQERCQMTTDIEAWKAKISGARLRYYDKVYSKENEVLSQRLKSYAPGTETGKLHQATIQETDAIISQVEALAIHVERCEKRANSATMFNLAPLRVASTKLNESFEFDTEQISSKLMDPINTTIKVDPHVEEENLNNRFEQVILCWDALKRALSNSNIPASELFKHDDLDGMVQKAKDNGIPLRWLKGHPLVGSQDEDQALYTRLEEPRQSDPVRYCRIVEENMDLQEKIGKDLDRLIEAKNFAISEADIDLSGLDETILNPDDDPQITLDRARQNQDRLAGLLESSNSVDEVEQQASKVHDLYQTCKAQAGAARNAIASANQEVEKANSMYTSLLTREREAQSTVQRASQVHVNIQSAAQAVEAGQKHLAAGYNALNQANQELSAKSHLASLRQSTNAINQFISCRDRFEAVDRSIADLEKARMQYDEMLGQMDNLYDDTVTKIRRYNGFTGNMTGYQRPTAIQGPADYSFLVGMLVAQQQSWQTEVLEAKRDYDLEIARQQAEERRREEARHHQSSFFSSSSESSSSHSSGSSWSSSSGDSGGSWGGGGSSSSGGDSGGSW